MGRALQYARIGQQPAVVPVVAIDAGIAYDYRAQEDDQLGFRRDILPRRKNFAQYRNGTDNRNPVRLEIDPVLDQSAKHGYFTIFQPEDGFDFPGSDHGNSIRDARAIAQQKLGIGILYFLDYAAY